MCNRFRTHAQHTPKPALAVEALCSHSAPSCSALQRPTSTSKSQLYRLNRIGGSQSKDAFSSTTHAQMWPLEATKRMRSRTPTAGRQCEWQYKVMYPYIHKLWFMLLPRVCSSTSMQGFLLLTQSCFIDAFIFSIIRNQFRPLTVVVNDMRACNKLIVGSLEVATVQRSTSTK